MYLVFGPSEASLIHPRGVVEKRQLYIDLKKKKRAGRETQANNHNRTRHEYNVHGVINDEI